jgi:hypothetical protein
MNSLLTTVVLFCSFLPFGDLFSQQKMKAEEIVDCAKRGIPGCQYGAGLILEEYDQGGIEELRGAVSWYKKSANQGYLDAQLRLGILFLYGDDRIRNEEEGIVWLEKAAYQKDTIAQFLVGSAYEVGRYGLDRNEVKAIYFIEGAAEQGYLKAQYSAARFFDTEFGFGTQDNPKRAFKWYEKAAEQEHVEAQLELVIIYLGLKEGQGYPKMDRQKAAFWCQRAIVNGSERGQKIWDRHDLGNLEANESKNNSQTVFIDGFISRKMYKYKCYGQKSDVKYDWKSLKDIEGFIEISSKKVRSNILNEFFSEQNYDVVLNQNGEVPISTIKDSFYGNLSYMAFFKGSLVYISKKLDTITVKLLQKADKDGSEENFMYNLTEHRGACEMNWSK